MSAVLGLAALVAVLILPLLVTAVRQRSLVTMAVRNINRRRGEAALVVGGALLGTAIITASFVVGDIVGGSITDAARTQLGPVDITVTPADGASLASVVAAVETAHIDAIDGLLPVRTATVTITGPASGAVLPRTPVMELDIAEGRAFGGDPVATGLANVSTQPGRGSVVLNERTANRLDVAAGDAVWLHAYGAESELVVGDVVAEVGLAGYAGTILAPGVLDDLATTGAAPPRAQLLVSLDGGVFDTRELSEATVAELRAAVAGIPGIEVDGVKAALLDNAEGTGRVLTQLFGTIGAFSVLAGILLLVNLFVMLAEERKSELGMLRALGFTRGRLSRAFTIEGAAYAVVAAILGAAVGIGVGWLVAVTAGAIFGLSDEGLTLHLVVEPASLALGALIGLTMSLVTIWLTSVRIARLNVIRAIRDLPEPKVARVRAGTLALAALGVLFGAGVATAGSAGSDPMLLLVGVPVSAFSAGPILRRLLPERPARLIVATAVLGWGLAAFSLFPDVTGAVELPVFVVQGVVLTAGAVTLAATVDRLWMVALGGLASHGRGLALRLGLAYPLARRSRTSLLLGMFSLVIFTMALIAAISTSQRAQAAGFTASVRGGYDLMIDSNPANPVDSAALEARDDVVAVAGLARAFASFETDYVDEPRPWPITGVDADLLARDVPALAARDQGYASDADVYRAVLADPSLAIVPATLLQNGPTADRVRPGDTIRVLEPTTGRLRELTAAATSSSDYLFNGVVVSRELTADLYGPQAVPTRHYVAVSDGVDPQKLAEDLNRALLTNGADASSFATRIDEALRRETAFLSLLQAFLALGLLVGIAGLGVVMVRAVRERRQAIGMLRAMGFPTQLVRAAFLSEAAFVAVQGTMIGGLLGLVTARQLMASSEALGDVPLPFTVPWLGLAAITITPILAALAATAWPASRAAAIRPAVALRLGD